ncbi:MAG: hypothetical protein AAFX04_13350 [Pseudomonadota bacterium]
MSVTRAMLSGLLLSLPLAFAAVPIAAAQSSTDIRAFAPPTGQPLLYRRNITRPAGDNVMSQSIHRCIRFTRIGRGYRLDARVADIASEGPDRLVALLGIGTAIKRDEWLILDLTSSGDIIAVQDTQATWQRLIDAVKTMRGSLEQRIAEPAARSIGYRLLDEIIATPPEARDAYLAASVLPILGQAAIAQQGSHWVYRPGGERATPVERADGSRLWALRSQLDEGAPALSSSEGEMTVAADGLLLELRRTIRTKAMGMERVSTEKWQRITDTGAVDRLCRQPENTP